MPVVTFVGGEMPDEMKADLVTKLTTVVCDVTNAPSQFVTVIIDEHKETNIGVGGETVVELKARLKAEKNT